MKQIICKQCAASDFIEINGTRICKYCGARYAILSTDYIKPETDINILSDIDTLLKKCKSEPHNAKKYANLILDIDPSNADALKYLK